MKREPLDSAWAMLTLMAFVLGGAISGCVYTSHFNNEWREHYSKPPHVQTQETGGEQ